jgi:hypothetical protein
MVVPLEEPQSPHPEDQAKTRRPISAAKHAANIANSKRSRGPTSITGKLVASANGVSHGMTCKTLIFLPGESRAEFDSEVARWARQRGAVTEPEIAVIETAVYCRYKQCRARNAQGAAGTRAINNVANEYHDRTAEEVRTLLPSLPTDPAGVVQLLRKTSQGCSHILEQFLLIKSRLETHSSFEVSQRHEFLFLSGRRPVDLFRDPMVFELDRLYLGAIGGPGSFTAAEAANALLHDRPEEMSEEEFERRLEPMVENLPTVADGHAALVALVDRTIAELTERLELVGLREERDLALDEVIARADVSHDGVLRERYDSMATRDQHASLREFCRLKELRHKHGEGEPEPQEPGDNPGDPPPSGPGQTVPEAPAQSEATVPQSDGAGEEAEGPIDATWPPMGEQIRNPKSEIRNKFETRNSKSETSEPEPSAPDCQAQIVDAPEEEDEAIRAAYQARLQRVFERIEQGEATSRVEVDPLANDHPPPGLETSA